MPLIKAKEEKFTYSDYVTWPDDERWELIDSKTYDMSPAPSIRHQKIVSNINVILSTHPQRKAECFVGIAPDETLRLVAMDKIEIPLREIFEDSIF